MRKCIRQALDYAKLCGNSQIERDYAENTKVEIMRFRTSILTVITSFSELSVHLGFDLARRSLYSVYPQTARVFDCNKVNESYH